MDNEARKEARDFGRRAEEQTAAWLEKRGYTILERNYRTRESEADIVARFGDTLAFIEVKARSSAAYGLAREAVTPRKQARVVHAARSWLYEHGMLDEPVRFDVVEVYPGRIRHIRNAFEAPAEAA
ncbi:MAG: YraN family protein [Oscillospiraceae bacterium]|jgi:putative endonuclease|nr:YraN family protein [Oscillospiraceae bacterium]